MKNFASKLVSYCLIASTLSMSVWVPGAQAGIITTDQVIDSQVAMQNRERVRAFFDREDVRIQLQARGVNAEDAKSRVDAMTDIEVASINGHIDSLPAGGDALSSILGFAFLVFIILLITDLLGLTHVYHFTKRR